MLNGLLDPALGRTTVWKIGACTAQGRYVKQPSAQKEEGRKRQGESQGRNKVTAGAASSAGAEVEPPKAIAGGDVEGVRGMP